MDEGQLTVNITADINPPIREVRVCPLMSGNKTTMCLEGVCAWWIVLKDTDTGLDLWANCAIPSLAGDVITEKMED